MAEQIIEFFPDAVSLPNREKADLLRTVILHKIEKSNSDFLKNFSSKDIPEILIGEEGMREGVSKGNFEVLINGIIRIAGLAPTYFAVKSGKNVALANKEALRCRTDRYRQSYDDSGKFAIGCPHCKFLQ